ncbi:MAG: hypothetical protein L6300_11565, partial [Syntrophaceae bacterium]|nr:hypothetical protein [Syntrophaceae bacterium]
EVIAKVPINSLPPGGGGLGWGGACREIRMLQIHPPPNPLPSREGEHILKSFAITSWVKDLSPFSHYGKDKIGERSDLQIDRMFKES